MKEETNSWMKMVFYHRYLLLNDGSVFMNRKYESSKKLSKMAPRMELNKNRVKEELGKRNLMS